MVMLGLDPHQHSRMVNLCLAVRVSRHLARPQVVVASRCLVIVNEGARASDCAPCKVASSIQPLTSVSGTPSTPSVHGLPHLVMLLSDTVCRLLYPGADV